MKYLLTLLLVAQFCVFGISQSSFSCNPDSIIIVKSADFEFFYNYTQFENHTNDTLWMRWKKVDFNISDGHGGIVNWGATIQDPNNFYSPASATDSADFFLPPTTTSTDKFLIQVYPNGLVGNLIAKIVFYPINNPTDTGFVYFDYTTTPSTSVQNFSDGKVLLMPNPAVDFFQIKNETKSRLKVQLVDEVGKIYMEEVLEKESDKNFTTEKLVAGLYFLIFEKKSEKVIRKLMIYK